MTDSNKDGVTSQVVAASAEPTQSSQPSSSDDHLTHLHLVRRGEDAAVTDEDNDNDNDNDNTDANGNSQMRTTIPGYDAHRMRARAALTAEEEKRLLRRIDWRLMPLCSLMFLLKNVDANSVCTYIQLTVHIHCRC